MLANLAAPGWALLGLASQAPAAAPQDPKPPVRLLVVCGGEHHQYEANMKALLAGLEKEGLKFTAEIARIDDPPAGKPAAEKATIPSKPDLLKDPKLGERFDVMVAYTQDSYIEKLGSDHVDGITSFVRSGGGWVGFHCAADTFKSWPEYVRMVGGRFETHPAFGPIQVQRVMTAQPVGAGIEDFTLEDELYHLQDCDAQDKNLLLVAKSPGDGKTRPVAWTKRYGQGKVFYTALGHGPGTYRNPNFLKMVRQAIEWAAVRENPTILFDGKSLDGWVMTGPGHFAVENGELVSSGGMGLLWYARRPFKDFALELEWLAPRKEDNSGVFVRFPQPVTPWSAVNGGYEIQICDGADPKHNTGSVYDFQAPTKVPTKAPGQWNQYRIEVRGQRYTIFVNGEKVNEFDGSRSAEGYVGLQNHDDGSRVRFRNIRGVELR